METWFIPLMTVIAAAVGGVVGSWIKLKSEEQKHLFDLKVDGYKNLITAYRKLTALDESASDYNKYQQKYVEAQEQVELIGSAEVINISKQFYEHSARGSEIQIQKNLVKAMRSDLQHNRKF